MSIEKYELQCGNMNIGDIVAINPITEKVKIASKHFLLKPDKIIGICNKIEDNIIYVQTSGIIDVNVEGIICIGDKLTLSNIPGKAEAIKYEFLDEKIFKVPCIGKVIGIYDIYDKVKVLLNL